MKKILRKSIAIRIVRYFVRSLFGYSVGVIPKIDLFISTRRFGGYYGGYPINIKKTGVISNVISCGVGRDVTFEIDLIKSGALSDTASIVLIDPTDESFDFFEKLKVAEDENVVIGFEIDGEKISEKIDRSMVIRLNYIKAAIGTQNSTMGRLVRHENWEDTATIEAYDNKGGIEGNVQISTISKICEEAMISNNQIDILKLDICGAELQVIPWLMEQRVFPSQIIVEFFHLSLATKAAVNDVKKCINVLLDQNYRCAGTDFTTKFTFVR